MIYVAIAHDRNGRVVGSWEADSIKSAQNKADHHNKTSEITIRSDRTSDGTYQGKGRGRVESIRERGKWHTT